MKSYFSNKKVVIGLVLFVLIVMSVLIGAFINNKNNTAEPDQNKVIDSASGLEIVNPDDRVPELGGGESIPVIGVQKLYDAGAPKTIVDTLTSELRAYGLSLQPKATKISIFKDSVKQVFDSSSPITTVVFDILISDKDKYTVSAEYLSIEFIDSMVIKDQSGNVIYTSTISGD